MNVYENDLLLNSETYKKRDCCFEKYLIIPLLQQLKNFVKKEGERGKEKEKARLARLNKEWIPNGSSIIQISESLCTKIFAYLDSTVFGSLGVRF